jgi:ParB-like chromosome segregation protein Spo0J
VRSKRQNGENSARYQILNGHHRAEVLKALGHTRARCDVWDVDDDEARMLLATLNRLEGRDDPKARARLVAHLATGRSAEDLARLLPEPPDAVERLLRLAEPPPEPAAAESLAPLPEALIFFLNAEQHALVSEALKEVQNAECRVQNALREPQGPEQGRRAEPKANGGARRCSSRPRKRAGTCEAHRSPEGDSSRLGRAERLERLALWYLESVGRR